MLYENIERLSALPGVSGREETVRAALLELLDGRCDCKVDALGNLLAFKRGAKKSANRLMFSAHMDEVGLIVTYIEDSGLLRFAAIGGIDRRTAVGKTVRIGKTRGVIGTKATHLKSAEERGKAAAFDALCIDIGAKTRGEAAALVSPGDCAVFDSRYVLFGDGFLRGRALDDRVGCALLVELLLSEQLPYDLHAAFTVQEETGATGAKTAAAPLRPDIAIAVETTTACDIPGTPPEKTVCSLKKDPVLSFMDRGTIYDAALYARAMQAAAAAGIACQPKQGVFGGNEARSVQTAGDGARVLAVSVPCRYLHTPSCVANRFDIDETLRLLRLLIDVFGA